MSNTSFFWSSNIKFLRNRKKISQMALAEKLDISRPKVNTHENGHVKNPPLADMILFSDFFKMSIDTLIKVDLSKLSELKIRDLEAGNDVYLKGGNIRILATTVNADNQENVELVPIKAKAGYLAGYSDPGFISKLPVFSLPQLDPNRKYRMFPTEGDSMLPVPEGALVIGEFLQDWSTLKKQTPCVVLTRDEGITFKLLTNNSAERSLLLESLNPLYQAYKVSMMDILEVWKFHSYFTDSIPEAMSSLEQVGKDVREIKAQLQSLRAFGN